MTCFSFICSVYRTPSMAGWVVFSCYYFKYDNWLCEEEVWVFNHIAKTWFRVVLFKHGYCIWVPYRSQVLTYTYNDGKNYVFTIYLTIFIEIRYKTRHTCPAKQFLSIWGNGIIDNTFKLTIVFISLVLNDLGPIRPGFLYHERC